MIEIKFLKDLPIKLTNTNKSVLTILGGDIYYDSDGNRYGFISFRNPNKSPVFALQLAIREYSVDGKFIRDNELFEAYTYYPTGDFVINEPILLDKEAEAIEVTIAKVTFRKTNFVNDRFVPFKQEDYVNLYQTRAPVKRSSNPGVFSFQAAPVSQQVAPTDEVSEQPEQPEQPVANEERMETVENPAPEIAATPTVPEENVAEISNFASEKKLFIAAIPFIGALALIMILVLVIMSAVTGGVEAFNAWYQAGGRF